MKNVENVENKTFENSSKSLESSSLSGSLVKEFCIQAEIQRELSMLILYV